MIKFSGIFHLSVYTLLIKDNKRLTPKLPMLELLELIRKDFIAKKCNLLSGLCEGCQFSVSFLIQSGNDYAAFVYGPYIPGITQHGNILKGISLEN